MGPRLRGDDSRMNFAERLADIRTRMKEEKLDLLIGVHDGGHFIETPNPVMGLSGFQSVATTAVLLYADGEMEIIVTPHWDSERAAEAAPKARVIGATDVVEPALAQIRKNAVDNAAIGISGLRVLPYDIASRLTAALPGAKSAD